MAAVNLPLSGNVPINQAISPWMAYFPMFGSQVGSYTVNVGTSTNPDIETAVLDVASYGKQLGRIEDALVVLLRHFKPEGKLPEDEQKAIDALKDMIGEIVHRKERHGAQGLRL